MRRRRQWEAAVATAAQHADALSGKVVVAMANGLTKVDREFRPVLPDEGSLAAGDAGGGARAHASRPRSSTSRPPPSATSITPIESDVIVCADDDARPHDRSRCSSRDIPDLRGFDGGSLANAVGIEAFAAVLLTINLRHKGKASLRLVGVEPRPPSGP